MVDVGDWGGWGVSGLSKRESYNKNTYHYLYVRNKHTRSSFKLNTFIPT